ncbi:hypothetical protein FM107_13430 [Sphingobacterium sp. JB170]|nr:hypothetical protein FM107_13430 [Sphingobacterium sp. JB170]
MPVSVRQKLLESELRLIKPNYQSLGNELNLVPAHHFRT